MELAARVARRWAAGVSVRYGISWPSSDRAFVYAYVDGVDLPVGEMELQLVGASFWDAGPCRGSVRRLLERLAELGKPDPKVYIVRNVRVEHAFRGRGLGKGLYEKVLTSCAPGKRGCILLGERCVGGKTSIDAERVWWSLASRWVTEGLAVASAPR